MTAFHCSSGIRSSGAPVPNVPALLTSTSILPHRATTAANRASTDAADRTSVATTSASPEPARPAVACRAASLRPARATRWPAASMAAAMSRPIPEPAPVITATGGAAAVTAR
jgi:hypothetical protein